MMRDFLKGMDCFRALRLNGRMVMGGGLAALLGLGIGYIGGPKALTAVLLIGGVAVIIAGSVLGYRYVLCPHCGAPLYDDGGIRVFMPSEIPDFCPHCGKRLTSKEGT